MTATVLGHGAEHGSTLPETAALIGAAAAVAVAYHLGVRRLLAAPSASSWSWRRWSFLAGLTVLVVVLLPPLEPLVEESFPGHMTQHIVLLLVAAPLLALGAPGLPLLLALPRRRRRRVAAVRAWAPVHRARVLTTLPALVVAVHAAVVLAWHLPSLYSAALASTAVHVTEHAAFLAVGWWFWSLVSGPAARPDGRTVLYVVVSALPMNLVGAVLTFAPRPLYPAQTGTGADALTQQQLAGLLMWIPAGVVYLVLCAAVVLLWFRRMDRETPAAVPLPAPVLPPPPERRRTAVLTSTDGEGRR